MNVLESSELGFENILKKNVWFKISLFDLKNKTEVGSYAHKIMSHCHYSQNAYQHSSGYVSVKI